MLVILAVAPLRAAEPESAAVSSASVTQRLEALEQKQKTLEDKLDLGPAPGGMPVVKFNPGGGDGFTISSADGESKLRIGAVIQADQRNFLNREAAGAPDQFLVRRARIYFEGVLQKYVEFRLQPDFAAGQALLQEAFVDLDYTPLARLQAGKFKEPFGLERLQADPNTLFLERGLTSDLGPNRDVGAQLHGDLWDKRVNYALALVDGVPDGGITDGDVDNNKDGVARVFVRPFLGAGSPIWADLGLGIAGSLGRQNGTAASSGLPTYATESQQTFFSYLAGVSANGLRRRLSPQAYWYPENFSLLGEYIEAAQMVARPAGGPTSETLTSRSWQVAGSWVLTGEKTSYGGLKPRRPFDPKNGGWGAWELAARYSALWVDSDAFPRYADPSVSSRRADAWTAGANWYLNSNTRFSANFMRTKLAGGSRDLEEAVFSRLQICF